MENTIYNKFIQNILDSRGRFGCADAYCERHHIVPRCLGGTDEQSNLIDLFAHEHFIAHKLLAEENPNNDKLIYAYWMMAHIGRVEVSALEYEEARIVSSKALSQARHGWYVGSKNPNYGNYWSEEQKRHMSQVKSNPPEETRKKMSLAQKSRLSDPANNPMFGKKHTEAAKRKIGEASRNRDPAVYAKISQKAKERFKNKENHPTYGKRLSEETRRKMSEARTLKPIGEKIVLQLSKDYKVIEVFRSTYKAAHELNLTASEISKCCNGSRNTYRDCLWKYLYDNRRRNGEFVPGAVTLGIITEQEALTKLNKN